MSALPTGESTGAAETRRLAQIALMWGGKLGPMAFWRLVGHLGSPEAVLQANAADLALPSLRLDPEQIAGLLGPGRDLARVEAVLARLAQRGVRVVCDFEPEYPAILQEMRDRPPVLCLAGRILPADQPAVAIVGTRSPTSEGRQMAERLARACAREHITVVSGLALGCDTAAHWGALRGGGRTLAVLGSGIVAVSPRENLDLARRITESGAVISEQRPGAQASSARLLARNRLQVGLAEAVIVVQAGPGGGAMQTAERAFRTGRLVYAVTWSSRSEKTEGNTALLARGARPLAGPEEIANLVRELYVHQERVRRARATEAVRGRLFAEGSPR